MSSASDTQSKRKWKLLILAKFQTSIYPIVIDSANCIDLDF